MRGRPGFYNLLVHMCKTSNAQIKHLLVKAKLKPWSSHTLYGYHNCVLAPHWAVLLTQPSVMPIWYQSEESTYRTFFHLTIYMDNSKSSFCESENQTRSQMDRWHGTGASLMLVAFELNAASRYHLMQCIYDSAFPYLSHPYQGGTFKNIFLLIFLQNYKVSLVRILWFVKFSEFMILFSNGSSFTERSDWLHSRQYVLVLRNVFVPKRNVF